MTEYDLTPLLSKNLDRHLIIPLLEFLTARDVCLFEFHICFCLEVSGFLQIYNADDMTKARIEMMKDTKMIDSLIAEYEHLGGKGGVPEGWLSLATINRDHTFHFFIDLQEKREEVLEELKLRKIEQDEILNFFQIEGVKKIVSVSRQRHFWFPFYIGHSFPLVCC